jgi:hypothetical protein
MGLGRVAVTDLGVNRRSITFWRWAPATQLDACLSNKLL